MPDDRSRDDHAVNKMATEGRQVLESLGGGGEILRRQTTYWDLKGTAGETWRCHFRGKREFVFDGPRFGRAEILDTHPLLWTHQQPSAMLFFSSSPEDPDGAERAVENTIRAMTEGWRGADDYCTPGARLQDGYGKLMEGPQRIVDGVKRLLEGLDVRCSMINGHTPRGASLLLLLGRSFIVAEAFVFEVL